MSDSILYWRLNFIDGDFTLVFPITLAKHPIVRGYHLELLKAAQGLTVWPPPPDDPDEESWDLYPNFPRHYQKLMALIDSGVDCDRVLPSSRHLFFICTEPIQQVEGKLIPGLSGLEQLMGFSLPKPGDEAPKKDESSPTTGNVVLDVKTDIYLVFKSRAPRLIEEHSLDELCRIAKQAGDRMQQAKEGEDDSEQEIKEAEDDDWFKGKKAAILNRLKSFKIAVPSNF